MRKARNEYHLFEVIRGILRSFFGEMTEEEREKFQRYIHEPGFLNNAEELEKREQVVTWLKEPSRFRSDAAYHKFQSHLKERRRVRVLHFTRVAAAFVLPLLIGGGAYFVWKNKNEVSLTVAESIHPISSKAHITLADGSQVDLNNTLKCVVEADGTIVGYDSAQVVHAAVNHALGDATACNELNVPRGGEYMLVLPDGTQVWVNAGSKLRFPVHFQAERREVYLEGEAYFAVEKDKDRPFIVHTSRGSVKVLGTEFNVRDYAEEHQTVTTLVQGSVQFNDAKRSDKQVILHPGEQVRIDVSNPEWQVRKVNLKEYVGWKDGLYTFNNLTLEELMKTVERNYDVTVFFANEECKSLCFSGDLQKYNHVESFLRFIEAGGDVRFVVKDRVITIYRK